jgi:holo-[acyl-carrier protein] synthase
MIMGVGIDIIEIGRVAQAIRREAFVRRVFTDRERGYCDERGAQRAASYAARFAGKEAVLKAFGTGLIGGSMQNIDIINDVLGCPQVELSGYFASLAEQRDITKIHISFTHAREYAAAQAILWRSESNESNYSS